jgi:hypothetical protein
MNEIEQQKLSNVFSDPLMQKAFSEVVLSCRRTDMDTVEKAALAQAYNNGLLAGLNALLDIAKIKQTVTVTTRKLRYDR